MKRTFAVIAAVVAVVVAAVFALPWLLTPHLFGSQLEQAVENATGRTLSFAGQPRVSLWPDVTLEFQQVELSNPPAMFQGRFMAADALRLKVSLSSLLRRSPEIEEIVAVRPQINLVVDGEGRSNFAPQSGGGVAERPRQAAADNASEGVSVPAITVVDGDIKYLNERSGAALALAHVDVTVSRSGLEGPLNVNGGFDWGRQRIAMALYVKSPVRLTAEGSPSDITLTSPLFSAGFNGRAKLKDGLALAGTLDFNTESLPDLVIASGFDGTVAPHLASLSVAGAVDISRQAIRFKDAQLALGPNSAQGDIAVSFKGDRPQVTGRLEFDRLDVATRLAPGGDEAAEPDAPDAGWSASPIDLSILNALDAQLSLAVAEIAYGKLATGPSHLDVRLNDGRLDATVDTMELYGGTAAGHITIDGSDTLARFSADVAGRNIDGGRLAADLSGLARLNGKADLDLDIAATGASRRELAGRLKGAARIKLSDGAIDGLDVPGLLAGLEEGALHEWAAAAERHTQFSALAASFAILDGIAETEDLALDGPAARVRGNGSIDVLRQRLDLRLEPQVRAASQGDNEEAFRGFPVPVVIDGFWWAPRVYPDTDGILDNPDKAAQALRQRIEQHTGDLDLKPDSIEKAFRKAGKFLGKKRRNDREDAEGQAESREMP